MAGLMQGKRGLIMGVANNRSIAWGIAQAMANEGAELAFSYQGDAFGQRVKPLAESVGSSILVDMDVTDDAALDAGFADLATHWDRVDFLVHAIAYSDKNELTGRFVDTSRENFKNSLDISCYSLIEVARRIAPMMTDGGTIMTMTYGGSNRVTPYYNVMGVAKAALESSVRYLANDLGPEGIRVNAISPGPMKHWPVRPSVARARPSAIRKRTLPCAATPRWRRSAARRSIWRRTMVPAPVVRSLPSTAAITCWACRNPRTFNRGRQTSQVL